MTQATTTAALPASAGRVTALVDPVRRRNRRRRSLRALIVGLGFCAPTLVVLGYFMYYPAYVSLVGAFTDWDGFNAPSFVGIGNFADMLSDPQLPVAVVNNVFWALGKIFLSLVPPFLVAELIFNVRSGRFQYLYRTLFVVPLIIPSIVFILIWTFYYRTDGLINQALGGLGLGFLQQAWLVDPNTALAALIFMGFPWVVPFNLLIFYAGLQSIPQEIRDAAAIDGATTGRRIWSIDIPMLTSQFNLLLLLALIGSVQAILEPLLMTGGGPGTSTLTPILYMYRTAVQYGQFGYSMAISLVLFIVVLILSVVSNRLVRTRD